ncbi:Pyrroline-5-carboxylate reductase [hydrothermal vent metagenome]|uniref:Pyrroline-5-carboxylate reductase n=1 Tax=hydrothermal vent metagenome TaxID=652676 RepID=A0A1W1ED97_9ZZZZ
MQTITFIGNGNMALSIANGLKSKYNIEVVGRDMSKLQAFEDALKVKTEKSLLQNFDITDRVILLCVKPANVEEVGKLLKGKSKVIFSVLAGTNIEKLKKHFKTKAVVRTMPNLAASIGESMTTLTGDIEFKSKAEELLGAVGRTLWLSSEKELDIATALAGSGPGYLSLIAESFADGAVKQGLKRDDALELTRGLFAGFGSLIQDIKPAELKDAVMSPGGTTAAGYAALEKGNVRYSCITAIEAAYSKTKEL